MKGLIKKLKCFFGFHNKHLVEKKVWGDMRGKLKISVVQCIRCNKEF